MTGDAARRYADWQALTGGIVDDFDPLWMPDLPSGLLRSARASRLGRRLLANRLAEGPAQAAMHIDCARAIDSSPLHGWALWPRRRLREALTDIGGLCLLPGIRVMVARSAVRRLRGALGEERYHWLVNDVETWWGSEPRNGVVRAATLLRRMLERPDSVREQIEMRGVEELAAAVVAAPPALIERLRLQYPPGWLAERPARWLPQSVLELGLEGRGGAQGAAT